MKHRKWTITVLIISLIFALGYGYLCIMVYSCNNLTDENTTLFTATIKDTAVLGLSSGDSTDGILYMQEYPSSLIIRNMDEMIDCDPFYSLQPGQTIHFRIQNYGTPLNEDYLKTTPLISIASLETSNFAILPLEIYQNYLNKELSSIWVTGIVVCSLFLAISSHCALLLKGINVFSRFKRHK